MQYIFLLERASIVVVEVSHPRQVHIATIQQPHSGHVLVLLLPRNKSHGLVQYDGIAHDFLPRTIRIGHAFLVPPSTDITTTTILHRRRSSIDIDGGGSFPDRISANLSPGGTFTAAPPNTGFPRRYMTSFTRLNDDNDDEEVKSKSSFPPTPPQMSCTSLKMSAASRFEHMPNSHIRFDNRIGMPLCISMSFSSRDTR